MSRNKQRQSLKWQLALGISLICLSAALYLVDYTIFRDKRYILNYVLLEVAFVPVQVLLVTLIISRLLNLREKRILLKKMNMVIGVFFSEVGTGLLADLNAFDGGARPLGESLKVDKDWVPAHFSQARRLLARRHFDVTSDRGDLEKLKSVLLAKRVFLLGLLENPNLLEHESFTELLWAVFHLAEELGNRKSLRQLRAADRDHLSIDIERAYRLLLSEWLFYMQHLKHDYPYLFSLAVRLNPLDPRAHAEIE